MRVDDAAERIHRVVFGNGEQVGGPVTILCPSFHTTGIIGLQCPIAMRKRADDLG